MTSRPQQSQVSQQVKSSSWTNVTRSQGKHPGSKFSREHLTVIQGSLLGLGKLFGEDAVLSYTDPAAARY